MLMSLVNALIGCQLHESRCYTCKWEVPQVLTSKSKMGLIVEEIQLNGGHDHVSPVENEEIQLRGSMERKLRKQRMGKFLACKCLFATRDFRKGIDLFGTYSPY